MTGRILACCALLAGMAAAQGQDDKKPKIDVSGGIEARLLSIAREGQWTITAQVRLTNASQNTASLLIFGIPTAIDESGMHYDALKSVSGVAFCQGPAEIPPRARACIGIPKMEEKFYVPMQGYTTIDPGKSALVNIAIIATGNGPSGGKASLAFEIAYRMIKPEDVDKDADVPEETKRKRVRLYGIDFPPQEVVSSTIKFDAVK